MKETLVGLVVGMLLAVIVYLISVMWSAISPTSGLIVAVALPLVSMWSNFLGTKQIYRFTSKYFKGSGEN